MLITSRICQVLLPDEICVEFRKLYFLFLLQYWNGNENSAIKVQKRIDNTFKEQNLPHRQTSKEFNRSKTIMDIL